MGGEQHGRKSRVDRWDDRLLGDTGPMPSLTACCGLGRWSGPDRETGLVSKELRMSVGGELVATAAIQGYVNETGHVSISSTWFRGSVGSSPTVASHLEEYCNVAFGGLACRPCASFT